MVRILSSSAVPPKKNAAGTLYFFSVLNTVGVQRLSGPSSEDNNKLLILHLPNVGYISRRQGAIIFPSIRLSYQSFMQPVPIGEVLCFTYISPQSQQSYHRWVASAFKRDILLPHFLMTYLYHRNAIYDCLQFLKRQTKSLQDDILHQNARILNNGSIGVNTWWTFIVGILTREAPSYRYHHRTLPLPGLCAIAIVQWMISVVPLLLPNHIHIGSHNEDNYLFGTFLQLRLQPFSTP